MDATREGRRSRLAPQGVRRQWSGQAV